MPLQFLNYSQNIPTTPRLLPIYSYSQTVTILKLIRRSERSDIANLNFYNSETANPKIKFPLLGLLSEQKYCASLQDEKSCALKRRAGSGRWYTNW